MTTVRRAILSVSDKRGLLGLARGLERLGVELVATGGTAKALKEAGLEVADVSEVTGFPEMLDGRLKTLHPKIHGAILARREDTTHRRQMEEQGIAPIDLVVVNLYPFEKTVAKPGCSFEDAIENIDIGGPTLIRAAAKNHGDVAVLVDPDDYDGVMEELQNNESRLSPETCYRLARKAFSHTAQYDSCIAHYLEPSEEDEAEELFPRHLRLEFERVQTLRYGENPHQKAAFYRETLPPAATLAAARQKQGKALSFNNLLDLEAALEIARAFEEPAAVVIKHSNPCGVAVSESGTAEALAKAKACDPVSAFGGVIGLNRPVDAATAEEIKKTFIEAVVAPELTEKAEKILAEKVNLRVVEAGEFARRTRRGFDLKRICGGLLVQEPDEDIIAEKDLRVVTARRPSPDELLALLFAWRIVKHVKSNAIVFAHPDQLVAVGAGQMSRVDSVKIAAMKAVLPTQGAVMASDAFFPFRDGIDAAAEAGIRSVIQPGGSKRDEEVIAAANEQDLAMVFTGKRHFKH